MRKIFYYDLSEIEYENNCHLSYEPDVEEFIDDLYSIVDFYSDNAGVVLDRLSDDWYTYEIMNDDGGMERRYVFVKKIERNKK